MRTPAKLRLEALDGCGVSRRRFNSGEKVTLYLAAAEGARRAGISKRKRRAEVYPDDINHTARVLLKHFDKEELIQALSEVEAND